MKRPTAYEEMMSEAATTLVRKMGNALDEAQANGGLPQLTSEQVEQTEQAWNEVMGY